MRTSVKAGLVALAVGAMVVAPVSAASAEGNPGNRIGFNAGVGRGLEVVGLVDGTSLVRFRVGIPQLRNPVAVTGLTGDTSLVGIDYRVQDGLLYGVGNAGGLYTIDDDAAATRIGQLTIPLDGANFGVDFNPAANALRITSDTGQNLRQPFATTPLVATVADTPLTNPAVPPATGTVPALGVTAGAYTNNDLDATTGTTLFGIDTTADRVSIQSPANSGTLVPTGNLGVDAGPNAGFDIYSRVRNGVTVDNQAFATLQVGGRYALYEIDVLTGAATRISRLNGVVSDLALPLDQR